MDPHATREYLAWSNTLAKMIGRLGLQGTHEQVQPNLADYLATKATGGPHKAPPAPPQHIGPPRHHRPL